MPTYDYQCGGCGHEFEEFQSFSEKALTTCPKCKKKEAPAAIRHRRGHIVQGVWFLRDRLPE